MQDLILQYLGEHWNKDFAPKVGSGPVPKDKPGDLALTFFELAKEAKKSPVELAQEVAKVLEGCDLVTKVELQGPYLNLFFSTETFFQQVFETPLQTNLLQGKKIIVEYSSPNTNKPLHLGHMRNHALGIALPSLLEAAGATVYRVEIINDKGLALAKTMLAYDRFANGKTPEDEGKKSDQFVGDLYVRYEQELKNNASLAEELPEIMQQWEAGDEKWVGIWTKLVDWVLEGMEETYRRQGVRFDLATRESDIYEYGRDLAHKGLKDGVFKQREDGTIYIDLTDHDMGEKVVLRADGTSIYLTQDLSLWPIRMEKFGKDIDEMIYVVATEQNYYFQTLFHSIEKLGLAGDTEFIHYGYELVNLPDGRMKSREGNVVDADHLMDELSGIAAKEIAKRNEDMSDEVVHETAEAIMNGAWKFYLLSTSPNKTITFHADKSIQFEGSTGPYLQYAGVRIKSLFRKAGVQTPEVEAKTFTVLGEEEKPLGVKILEFPHVINRASEHKNPTYIVTYLLELSQAWSKYYAENQVINIEDEVLKKARLALAAQVLAVLDAGLKILGIEIPERM